MSTAARVAVLERIATVVHTEPRHRSPVEVEVPESRTMAYVDLILAIGRARLAAADTRVFSGGVALDPVLVVDQARATLGDAAADPVHGWLLDAFGWRIARTLEGASSDMPLAPELLDRRAALDRVAGYKVDRLRQETMLFDPAHVDPFDAFDVKPRVVARGRAKPERSAFDPLVQARRQLGHRLASGAPRTATLEAFLAAYDREIKRFVDRLVIAGVAAALEPTRGEEDLDEAHAELARGFDLQLFRRLGLAYGLAPADRAASGIERLLRRWPIITDALGTTSHFGILALVFVDVLVGAVTDPARPD